MDLIMLYETLMQKLTASNDPKIQALIPQIEALTLKLMVPEYEEAIIRAIDAAADEYLKTAQLPNIKDITLAVAKNQAWLEQNPGPKGDWVIDINTSQKIPKAPTDEEYINSLFGLQRWEIHRQELSERQKVLADLEGMCSSSLCADVASKLYSDPVRVTKETAYLFIMLSNGIHRAQKQILAAQCFQSFDTSDNATQQESNSVMPHLSKDAAVLHEVLEMDVELATSVAMPIENNARPSAPLIAPMLIMTPSPTHPARPTQTVQEIHDSKATSAAAASNTANLQEIWDSIPAQTPQPAAAVAADPSEYTPSENASAYNLIHKVMQMCEEAVSVGDLHSANEIQDTLALPVLGALEASNSITGFLGTISMNTGCTFLPAHL